MTKSNFSPITFSDVQIRLIQANDNPAIAQIIRTVMTEYECVGEGYSINDPEVDQMFETYNNDRSAFFVLEDEEGLAGCGGIGPLANGDSSICELKKMYFYRRLRGRGLGRKLIELCLDRARQIGYKQCYLETVDRMAEANALYQKVGFRKLSCPVGDTGHSSCDAYYSLDLFSPPSGP
ncbi:MAG: GNAT family N-acetyltransferase [Bacteroidota bacterium]